MDVAQSMLSKSININNKEMVGVKPSASSHPSQFANPISNKASFNELTLSEQAVQKAIEKANRLVNGVGVHFQYSVHEKTRNIMVKVIDNETEEIIREIPPEKILDLVAKLQEICGVIIDEKR